MQEIQPIDENEFYSVKHSSMFFGVLFHKENQLEKLKDLIENMQRIQFILQKNNKNEKIVVIYTMNFNQCSEICKRYEISTEKTAFYVFEKEKKYEFDLDNFSYIKFLSFLETVSTKDIVYPTTKEELKKFIEIGEKDKPYAEYCPNCVRVVGFFIKKLGIELIYKEFIRMNLLSFSNRIEFALIRDASLLEDYQISRKDLNKEAVVVFSNSKNKTIIHAIYNNKEKIEITESTEELFKFFVNNCFSYVMDINKDFNLKIAEDDFGSHLIFFYKNKDFFDKNLAVLENIASFLRKNDKKFHKNIIFSHFNLNENKYPQPLDIERYLNGKDWAIILIKYSRNVNPNQGGVNFGEVVNMPDLEYIKFVYNNNEISEKNLTKFIKNSINMEMNPFIKSAEIPKEEFLLDENGQKILRTIVTKNYNSIINSKGNHIVLFCEENKNICKAALENYKKHINIYYKNETLYKNYELNFHYMNLEENDVEYPKILSYPCGRIFFENFTNVNGYNFNGMNGNSEEFFEWVKEQFESITIYKNEYNKKVKEMKKKKKKQKNQEAEIEGFENVEKKKNKKDKKKKKKK